MDLQNVSYRLLRRLKLQRCLNWRARRSDGPISVPLLGHELGAAVMLYKGSWKSDALKHFTSCFPVSMVLDVGANEGQTLVDLVKAGLGHVEALAFEPNPACAYYLQHLVRENRWSNVTVLPIALSDGQRCLSLDLNSENNSAATFSRSEPAPRRSRLAPPGRPVFQSRPPDRVRARSESNPTSCSRSMWRGRNLRFSAGARTLLGQVGPWCCARSSGHTAKNASTLCGHETPNSWTC